MNKIKKNDEVILTTGKDSGKRGKVTRILTREKKLIVGGLNMYKRHLKRRSEKEQSQIISKELGVDMSNVKLICPHCNTPTRVKFEMTDEKKIRICKKCKKTI